MIVDVNVCSNCILCAGTACLAYNKSIKEIKGKDCGFYKENGLRKRILTAGLWPAILFSYLRNDSHFLPYHRYQYQSFLDHIHHIF